MFDRVYLCYPDERVFEGDFLDVVELTLIGFMAWNNGIKIVRKPKKNPLVSDAVKKIFTLYYRDFLDEYSYRKY